MGGSFSLIRKVKLYAYTVKLKLFSCYQQFLSSFQTMAHFLQALCLVLLLHQCTGDFVDNACIGACRRSFLNPLCTLCAKLGPSGVTVCSFACKTTTINPRPLTRVCENCFFKRRQLMESLCVNECIHKTVYETGILCETCNFYGLQTGLRNDV